MFGDEYQPGRYLYHYTTPQGALGSILPTQTIRMSPFRWMNDPRESKAMLSSLAGDSLKAGINAMEILERAQVHLQDRTKIAAFTLDVQPTYPTEMFARGFSRARMWAMYATHAGCCLVFDRERLDAAMRVALSGRAARCGLVTYSDYGPFPPPLSIADVEKHGVDGALENYITQNWEVLLLHKNMDWVAEAEYRWIVRESQLSPIFVPYADALVAVISGPDMSVSDTTLMMQYGESHRGVELARMWWRNGYPVVLPLPQ